VTLELLHYGIEITMNVNLRCKLATQIQINVKIAVSVSSQYSPLCFRQIWCELVYSCESYHRNRKSELFYWDTVYNSL